MNLTGRLLFTEDPDPRVLHSAFLVLYLLDLALRKGGGSSFGWWSYPVAGAAVAVFLGVAALVLPWDRLPGWAAGVLPVLEIAALGLSRLDDQPGGSAFLVVVPALWLGRRFGRRGALTASVATVLLLALPGLLYLGVDGATVSRSVLIPLVASWSALAMALGLERLRHSLREAEQGRTELREALVTIKHQRRVADAILDSVDVGLVLLDRHGAYASINKRHRDFMALAYPDGHAGRAGQLGLVYASDGTTVLEREQMPTYRASLGEEFDDERIWVGDDPLTRRALSVSARSVRDDDGTFGGAALAYTDVTDLMRALRVKDEFVASVSHELRTPLTSIMGYAQILLERDDLDRESQTMLGVVERNTQRLDRLVADLLHTAQVDEGPVNVVRRVTDLAELVRESVEAARPSASASDLEVDLDVPDTLLVRVDAQRIAQVADNLVSNAIKYSRPGGRISVRLARDGSRAELSVADTGIGIEAADRDRLFTRFFRARDAEERSIQGVGLGLSITKSIVESHGGRIEVESQVGRGSVFRVRLPMEADLVARTA